MREALGRTVARARGVVVKVDRVQGVLGVGFVTGGVLILTGVGWACITFGAFLLVGAWGSR